MHGTVGAGTGLALGKWHRWAEAATEPRVGDPVFTCERHQLKLMRQWRHHACFHAQQNPRKQRPDRKAQRAQRIFKQPVLFKTIAATATMDELFEHCRAVESDAATERNV